MAKAGSRQAIHGVALRGALLGACAASFAVGCSTEAPSRALSWRVSFANEATAARADRVEVSIKRGSCSSDDVVYQAEVVRDGKAPSPPKLDGGRYALTGRALSDECKSLAYGCVQVQLPATDGVEYEVVLDDVPELPVCDGLCEGACGDAGEPQSGLDAAAREDASDLPEPDASANDDASADDAGADAAVPMVPCSDGKSAPNGHCYRFVTSQKLGWQDAENDCVTWGGHLVSLNDADEELWVAQQSQLEPFESPIRFWIGFTDALVETDWRWTDGSADPNGSLVVYNLVDPEDTRFRVPFDDVYTHWGNNAPSAGNSEPNNGSATGPTATPGEDCAESRGNRLSGPNGESAPLRPEWDDQSCTVLKFYVCERSE